MKVTFFHVDPPSVVPSITAEPPSWTLPMTTGTASVPGTQQTVLLAQLTPDIIGRGTSVGNGRTRQVAPPSMVVTTALANMVAPLLQPSEPGGGIGGLPTQGSGMATVVPPSAIQSSVPLHETSVER